MIEDFIKKAKERMNMKIEMIDHESVLKRLKLVERGKVRSGALLIFQWTVPAIFLKLS